MTEHEFKFSVELSDGKTERRFTVSQFPAYFLVGQDGKIGFARLTDPPTAPQIEAELAKKGRNMTCTGGRPIFCSGRSFVRPQ